MIRIVVFFVFAEEIYFPEAGENWKRRKPEDAGLDAAKLKEAKTPGRKVFLSV